MAAIRIVALEGDQTGQELLEQSLRVLDPEVLGLDLEVRPFDLSLAGTRTPDLGGHASTTELTDAVIELVRRKLEAWGSLGT